MAAIRDVDFKSLEYSPGLVLVAAFFSVMKEQIYGIDFRSDF